MVAPDRVMVRDRAAVRDERVGGRGLDRVPLRELLGFAAERPCTVKYGAGPSGYTCVNRQVTTAGARARLFGRVRARARVTCSCSAGNASHVHAVSNVSLITPRPTSASRVYGARTNALRQLPAAPFARAFARGAHDDRVVGDLPAVVAHALDRARDPRVEGMVGRLEREQQDRVAAIVGAGELRLRSGRAGGSSRGTGRTARSPRAASTAVAKSPKRAVAEAR